MALKDYSKTIFRVFQDVMKESTGDEYQFSGSIKKKDRIWLTVLSKIDWQIRKERRINILKGLDSVNTDRRIVITADPKLKRFFPNVGKNIEWIGEIPLKSLITYTFVLNLY